MFALFKVKNLSIFCFFSIFGNLISLQKEKRIFENKQETTKNIFLKLKIGPIMLRNILGPVFNFKLDQFLTLEFSFFFVFFSVFLCFLLAEISAKHAKLKETRKEKTLFVNTLVPIVLVKMSVLFPFSAFFIFVVFGISMFFFFRDVFDRFPKIKKLTKYESNKNKKTTRKQDAKQKHI